MKNILHFIGLALLFIMPLAIYYSSKEIMLLYDGKYKTEINGNEIYRAIEKSKKNTKYRKLILGDSTANQFYNCKEEEPDSAYSLSCNQAIGMVGQFILLNNYLEAGNRPDSVVLVFTPLSFWDNLDQVFTFHYFLKPFYYSEYKPLMSKTVLSQIRKIPYHNICHIPFIQTTDWAPNIQPEERHYTFLSPICKEYLTKIDSLSIEYKFHYDIIPTFVAEHWKKTVTNFKRSEFQDCKYAQKMTNYLDNITFLPDTCFIDNIHLANPQLYRSKLDSMTGAYK